MNGIIIRPIFSEKSLADQKQGRYSFVVVNSASKGQIAQAIKDSFSVGIDRIWTKKRKGKSKRTGSKRLLKQYPSQKIAVVQLAKGDKIDILEAKK